MAWERSPIYNHWLSIYGKPGNCFCYRSRRESSMTRTNCVTGRYCTHLTPPFS
nr:MAG TPA: hypothetical protein [Caudoviricetes sp.]